MVALFSCAEVGARGRECERGEQWQWQRHELGQLRSGSLSERRGARGVARARADAAGARALLEGRGAHPEARAPQDQEQGAFRARPPRPMPRTAYEFATLVRAY